MNQPNLLLISIDSLRMDAVSAIDNEIGTTPFLGNSPTLLLYSHLRSLTVSGLPLHTHPYLPAFIRQNTEYTMRKPSREETCL